MSWYAWFFCHSAASQLHREAYIWDTTNLKQRPQAWPGQKEDEEEEGESSVFVKNRNTELYQSLTMCVFPLTGAEFELSVDEPEEFLVDDPDEVPWLAELLNRAPVSAPLVMRSSRWAGSSQSQTPHSMGWS